MNLTLESLLLHLSFLLQMTSHLHYHNHLNSGLDQDRALGHWNQHF